MRVFENLLLVKSIITTPVVYYIIHVTKKNESISKELSAHQALEANPKALQQINFIEI